MKRFFSLLSTQKSNNLVLKSVFLTTLVIASDAHSGLFSSSAQSNCESLKKITVPGFDVEISSAVYIDDPDKIPSSGKEAHGEDQLNNQMFTPYCNLKGYFEKRIGVDDKPYAIGFGLALPDNWNGRFLFQGGGALNGLIREPLGARAAGDTPALFQGFAVASTDSGHQSESIFNTDFFADQQSLLNFYSQAIVKTTQLTRDIVHQFYKDKPQHSYFVGCSTGGREAMTMSQRYPLLFDGIIAGAPARQTNYSEIADLWSAKALRSTVTGNEPPFSHRQQQLIVNTLLEQCDDKDGLKDGMIFNQSACHFEPSSLQCDNSNQGGECLTEQQVNALDKAFAGPRLASGENIYPGFFYDTGINASAKTGIPGLLEAIAGPLGRARMGQPFDLTREIAHAEKFPLAPGNATLTNLSSFAAAGHKLMFFHGVSDPWFSAKDTIGYYNDMVKDNGGMKSVKNWSHLYLVPGMGHCQGGTQALDEFNMLEALVDWVEEDRAPSQITATGKALPGRSRPLCAYPSHAQYKGTGDSENASSFECR